MLSTRTCTTVLLEDAPSTADGFGSAGEPGAHHRVAQAVAEMIMSTQGGKAIGLEGGWGAGKSTVVAIVREMLNLGTESKDTAVVSFDAWAHEGDPLRRTYLETLIKALQERQWVTEAWEKKLEEIANRRKVTESRTTPKPTALGTWLAISLFLVPLGTVFLKEAIEEGVAFGLSLPIHWAFIIGLLALGPVFVVICNAIKLALRPTFKISRPFSLDQWSFLEGKTINETRTETVETPNPTSLEFEGYFDSLMRDALALYSSRRIVLVLDNLDRVDAGDALRIWSTLQTFLQQHQRRSEKWFQRLWVLVPYDPTGFRRLWGGVDGDVDEREVVFDSFLDKSFHIRFTVPPLITSDWKNHLYKLLGEALPSHSNDRHSIYKVFDQCRSRPTDPPTPRELKVFVNQIGAVHRQWFDEFPMEHCAYFVLACRDRREFVTQLRYGMEPTPTAVRLLGANLRQNLAGLAFNVRASRGQQLLLTDPIYQALLAGRSKELAELADSHKDGFWSAIESIAHTKFHEAGALAIAHAAISLEAFGLLERPARPEIDSILNCLRAAATGISPPNWGHFSTPVDEGFSALFRLINDKSFTQALLQTLRDVLRSDKSALIEDQQKQIGTALINVLETARRLGHEEVIPKRYFLPVDANGWKTVCQELVRQFPDRRHWNNLRPNVAIADVLISTSAVVQAGQFTELDISVIEVLDYSNEEVEWNALIGSIRDRLQADKNPSMTEIRSLTHALFLLRTGKAAAPVAEALGHLANGGHTMHNLGRAARETDQRCQALLLCAYLIAVPDGSRRNVIGRAENGYQHLTSYLNVSSPESIEELAQVALGPAGIEWLFIAITAIRGEPLLLYGCLDAIVRSDAQNAVLTPDRMLEHWTALRTALRVGGRVGSITEFVARSIYNTDLGARVQQREFTAEMADLYQEIVSNATIRDDRFLEWCEHELEALESEAWARDMTSTFALVKLAQCVHDQRADWKLGIKFFDTLKEHAAAVAVGEQLPPETMKRTWKKLANLLPTPLREELSKSVIRVAVSRDGQVSAEFFELYGDVMKNVDALSENTEVLPRMFSPWIREPHSLVAIEWMHDVIANEPTFWRSVRGSSGASEFTLRLREYLGDASQDPGREAIRRLAKVLNIQPE